MPRAILREAAATLLVTLSLFAGTVLAAGEHRAPLDEVSSFRFDTLRLAIEDLAASYGNRFASAELLAELSVLQEEVRQATAASRAGSAWPERRLGNLAERLSGFKRRALLGNPAVKDLRIRRYRKSAQAFFRGAWFEELALLVGLDVEAVREKLAIVKVEVDDGWV